MTKSIPLALLAGAALLSGTAAIATTPQAKPVAAKPAPAAKPVAAKPAPAAKPMVATKTTKTTKVATTRKTATAAKGRMVTAKLANGKTVTYNCSLAGNATKQACKS